MSKSTKDSERITQDAGKLHDVDKQARLAEALRANLRRRKEQARDRKSDDGQDS